MTVMLAIERADGAAAVPGTASRSTLRVRNAGTIVQGYDLHVLGRPAAWAHVEPSHLQLMPGQEAVAQLVFDIPPGPATPAGAMPFAVQAMGQTDPSDAAVEESALTIAGVVSGVPELRPLHGRGRNGSHHTVFIENTGNISATFSIWAADPDDMVEVLVSRDGQLVIAPGEIGEVKLETKTMDRILFGRARRTFQVHVSDPAGNATTIDATLDQRGWPRWVMAVPVVIAVLAALILLRSCNGSTAQLALGTQPTTTAALATTTSPAQLAAGDPPGVAPVSAGAAGPSGGGPVATTAPSGGGGGTKPAGGGSTRATTTRAVVAPTGPSPVVGIAPVTSTTRLAGPTISSVTATPSADASGTSTIALTANTCGNLPSQISVNTVTDATATGVTVTFTPTDSTSRTAVSTRASPDGTAWYATTQGSDLLRDNPPASLGAGRSGRTFAITVVAQNASGGTTTRSSGQVVVLSACG